MCLWLMECQNVNNIEQSTVPEVINMLEPFVNSMVTHVYLTSEERKTQSCDSNN